MRSVARIGRSRNPIDMEISAFLNERRAGAVSYRQYKYMFAIRLASELNAATGGAAQVCPAKLFGLALDAERADRQIESGGKWSGISGHGNPLDGKTLQVLALMERENAAKNFREYVFARTKVGIGLGVWASEAFGNRKETPFLRNAAVLSMHLDTLADIRKDVRAGRTQDVGAAGLAILIVKTARLLSAVLRALGVHGCVKIAVPALRFAKDIFTGEKAAEKMRELAPLPARHAPKIALE